MSVKLIRPLTPLQIEVLQLIAKGWRRRKIAQWFGVNPKRIDKHKAAIRIRLSSLTDDERLELIQSLLPG